MGQKLTADTARKIDGQLATDLNNSLNNTMQGVDASVDRMLWAINRNNAIDTQASFVSEDASNLARRNQVVTSTNAYSDLTQANIQSVSYQHELNKYNRALNAQAYDDQVRARYERGNQMVANEFSKFKLTGTDFSKAYDWDKAIAFQDAAWADGKRRAQIVQQGKDVFKQAYETGEVTIAWGGTAGVSAGTGVDGAVGHFVSVDFNKGNFTYGGYLSGEMASNLGIPAPEVHGGGEISIYPTSKYQDALKGPYTIYGGEFDAKLGAVSAGLVKTNNGQLTGFQASLVFSTPSLTKLPGHSAFIRAGGGTATEVLSFNYKNWW